MKSFYFFQVFGLQFNFKKIRIPGILQQVLSIRKSLLFNAKNIDYEINLLRFHENIQ